MQIKKILIAIILSFAITAVALAAPDTNTTAGTEIKFSPSVPLPGVTDDTAAKAEYFKDGSALGRYITALYKFGFSIIGILATITMMYGGLLYIIAAGDSGKESEARKWITASLSGVTLMLSTYVILNFVNPDLVKFRNLSIDPVSNERNQAASTAKQASDSTSSCEGNCSFCCLTEGGAALTIDEYDYNHNRCEELYGLKAKAFKDSKPSSDGKSCVSFRTSDAGVYNE